MASTTSAHAATALSVATAQGSLLKMDTRGRVRTSKERRQAILAAFDRSGVSAAQFAKLTGLRYSTFAGWVSRQRKAKAGSQAATPAAARRLGDRRAAGWKPRWNCPRPAKVCACSCPAACNWN